MTKVAEYGLLSKPIPIQSGDPPTPISIPKEVTPINFYFRGYERNPDYQAGLVKLSEVRAPALRASLKYDKSGISQDRNLYVKTEPKWVTRLGYLGYDSQTGELMTGDYQTNDLKAGNARKIKVLDRFSDYYQPLYREKKVSLMFHTLTQADYSGTTVSRLIDTLKYRYSTIDRKVRGYFWSYEISEPEYQKIGFHFHYHMVVAIDRLNIKGGEIPEAIMLDETWGQMTKVEFVKRSVRGYLKKYIAKNNWRIVDMDKSRALRMFGQSQKFE